MKCDKCGHEFDVNASVKDHESWPSQVRYCRDALKAQLATAVQALEFYAATSTYRPHIESGPISEDCDRSLTTKDLDFGVAGQCARDTLRALGIDPSKEKNK